MTPELMADLIADAIDTDGLSQAEFCRRVGVSQKHVSLVLSGQAHAALPTLDYWAFCLGRHFTVKLVRGIKA